MAQLTQVGFAEILCTHEAAHVFFFTMAGMQTYDTFPARLWYNPAIDDYEGSLASIKVGPIPPAQLGHFDEYFQHIAAAHAAGGVAARKLRPISDVGDQDDKDRFQQMCDKLNAIPNFPPIDAGKAWVHAREYVRSILEEPRVWDAIRGLAEELRPQFGL